MIKLIVVGKIKEKYIRDGIDEYKKRISKYSKLEIIEVQDYDYPVINMNLEKEANEIKKYINQKDYVVTLEIEGKNFSSIELAKKIDEIYNTSSTIIFIIGGSYGLSNSIKERSNLKLSFSKLTFPHQLFRLILLEQIYRSFKINNNEAYHK